MLQIKLNQVCEQAVRHFLLKQDISGENAMYFNFDVRLAYFRGSISLNQSRGLHLLYHCATEGSSYVSVFSGITSSPFAFLREVPAWKHETTHDSCWQGINVFSKVYFDMAEKINEALEMGGHKTVPACEMSESTSFAGLLSNQLFQWVPVQVGMDPNDERNYRRTVKVLEVK